MLHLPTVPSRVPPPPPHPPHPAAPTMPVKPEEPKDKKPRIRHSEAQLAALNELYEANEHPSLEERADLADRLQMEPKAVNAWFANKRSATKKKTRGSNPLYSTPPPHTITTKADDDDLVPFDMPSRLSTPLGGADFQSFPAVDSDSRHVFDSEISAAGVQRRMRIRPSPHQTQELRRLYSLNTHPSREEREALGHRIDMKYQSVTNWFQNQRSLARKRMEEQDFETQSVHSNDLDEGSLPSRPESRAYHSFPPTTGHPSLASSVGPSRGPSMPPQDAPSRSYSDGHVPPSHEPKLAAVRRLAQSAPLPRPRRTRPEPFQLEALKKLFMRTQNPSIEERGALALEIGMELGKVTNWFRNLRQTARKRAAKGINDDGDDESMDYDESAPVSLLGTPMFHAQSSYSSSAASVDGDIEHMDLDGQSEASSHHHIIHHHLHHHHRRARHSHSDGSEEEDQEAVTPPPAAPRAAGRRRMDVGFLTGSSDDLHMPPSTTKPFGASAPVPVQPPRLEDALLLLSFSRVAH